MGSLVSFLTRWACWRGGFVRPEDDGDDGALKWSLVILKEPERIRRAKVMMKRERIKGLCFEFDLEAL